MSRLKRIIIHWTAGNYKANATDKKSYHYIVEGDGVSYSDTEGEKICVIN